MITKKTKGEFMNENWKREKYLTFLNYNKKQYLELLKER